MPLFQNNERMAKITSDYGVIGAIVKRDEQYTAYLAPGYDPITMKRVLRVILEAEGIDATKYHFRTRPGGRPINERDADFLRGLVEDNAMWFVGTDTIGLTRTVVETLFRLGYVRRIQTPIDGAYHYVATQRGRNAYWKAIGIEVGGDL